MQGEILTDHEQKVNTSLFFVFALTSLWFFPLARFVLKVGVARSISILAGVLVALIARLLNKAAAGLCKSTFILWLWRFSAPSCL